MTSLQQQHIRMSRKDGAHLIFFFSVKWVSLSVLACVWYVWSPLEKQGCVGANPLVGHSHSAICCSGGKITSHFKQGELTAATADCIKVCVGLTPPLFHDLTSHSALHSISININNSCIHTDIHSGPTGERGGKYKQNMLFVCIVCLTDWWNITHPALARFSKPFRH